MEIHVRIEKRKREENRKGLKNLLGVRGEKGEQEERRRNWEFCISGILGILQARKHKRGMIGRKGSRRGPA